MLWIKLELELRSMPMMQVSVKEDSLKKWRENYTASYNLSCQREQQIEQWRMISLQKYYFDKLETEKKTKTSNLLK
jgi:hypothetical protein